MVEINENLTFCKICNSDEIHKRAIFLLLCPASKIYFCWSYVNTSRETIHSIFLRSHLAISISS